MGLTVTDRSLPVAKAKSTPSDRSQKMVRLLAVSLQRKALEKEEDQLKTWFKKDCKDVPTVYKDDEAGVVVETSIDTRTLVDGQAVRAEFGTKFDKVTTFMKVVARDLKEAAA